MRKQAKPANVPRSRIRLKPSRSTTTKTKRIGRGLYFTGDVLLSR